MIFFCLSFPIHGENKDKDLVMLLYTGKYRKRKGGGGPSLLEYPPKIRL